MTCFKCGAENMDGSSFCIKCGANLKEGQQASDVNAAPNPTLQTENVGQVPQANVQPNPGIGIQQNAPVYNNQPMYGAQTMAQPVSSVPALNFLMYIVGILMKPFKTFKDENSKLNDSKNSLILSLIVVAAMTIFKLITTVITSMREVTYSYTGGYTYSWEFNNIKNIKWFEVIGKNFLIYAGVVLAIALVFYFGSLVIKKELNLLKALSIAASAVIPAAIGVILVSPIAGIIWQPLNMTFAIIGGVYSLIILIELMNEHFKLEGDVKIYFYLVCLIILLVAGYFVFREIYVESVKSELNSILDMY